MCTRKNDSPKNTDSTIHQQESGQVLLPAEDVDFVFESSEAAQLSDFPMLESLLMSEGDELPRLPIGLSDSQARHHHQFSGVVGLIVEFIMVRFAVELAIYHEPRQDRELLPEEEHDEANENFLKLSIMIATLLFGT